ncbi:MAG: mercury methylation ferredoxin HgcB [bacterium]
MARLLYLPDVTTLKLDVDKCIGCGMCADVCPHGVLVIDNRKSRIVDRDACIECGAYAVNCPVEAITVESGVGCAAAFITGALRGTEPACGCCGDDDKEDGEGGSSGCCC